MGMKVIGDFIFSFWTFTTYSIPILQNYSTFPYNAFAILAIQYLHFLYFQVCMFLFLLSRLCSNNCLHKLSEYMYSSFPYWTNKFTLEKAFLQIAFGERKKKKGNVGLEFVAASNKFQNNERITLKTFDAWNALFALKREKTCPVGATGPLPRKEKCLRWWDV